MAGFYSHYYPSKKKHQKIAPITISAICPPLYEVCSVTKKSDEFRLAKFKALNGGIRNTNPNMEINEKGRGSCTNAEITNQPIKSKTAE